MAVSLVNFRSFSELPAGAQQPQPQQQLQADGGARHAAEKAGRPTMSRLEVQQGSNKYLLDHQKQPAQAKEHFEIRWSNLNYQVEPKWYKQGWRAALGVGGAGAGDDTPGAHKQRPGQRRTTSILNGLNGSVKSGQVTAVLGPSGAGKTSLLGCLTGKNKSGVSGSVEVIATEGGPGRLEPLSICTIPQKDFLLNQLTVRENLWFASHLKHPTEGFDHDTNIERVVNLLKLQVCLDTTISKISGGQYKRVSIAQELLSNPDILILDEPTSGLDSLTCYRTVMVLRDLARLSPEPMAIIVTIHQPQREVFDLFNHVYILAVGGRCIYEGQPSKSIKTINECGAGLHFDADQYNPASYLVEIASAEFGSKPIEALVEHQRNEFWRQASAQDQRNWTLSLAQGRQANGQLTPSLRKRAAAVSPMITRFKSMLTGGSPSPAARNSSLAYANEAYQSNQTLDELAAEHLAAASNGHHHASPLNNNEPPPPDRKTLIYGQEQRQPPSATPTEYHQHQNLADMAEAASYATDHAGAFHLDTRLQTHKHNHKGHFLRHCQLLTKRSWLCLCKDPMLTTLRFSAHIIVPLLITIVYGSGVGKPNACPLFQTDLDLIDYARNGAKRLLNLQNELRCTFENVGLYFLSVYAFTFSTMCLTSLSFPLNMHVLLKEVRNGWYSIPTYFIGKTLADFPLEFILPTLTLMITYPLTGQPSSYLEWRFITATGIFVITSLIAQTQGLIFGALFMNAMQAAVFVAPVSTTPLILLSGFLIRISQMPIYLQKLSCFSYFRYAIESLAIIRYGFGQCECDPSLVTGQPVRASGVPDQLRTMTNYWLSTFDEPSAESAALEATNYATTLNDTAASLLANATAEPAAQVDFFQDLTVLLARANSFGADIKTCKDLKPYPMIDFSLEDDQLYTWVVALVATLILSKVANYYVVKYSVKWRL